MHQTKTKILLVSQNPRRLQEFGKHFGAGRQLTCAISEVVYWANPMVSGWAALGHHVYPWADGVPLGSSSTRKPGVIMVTGKSHPAEKDRCRKKLETSQKRKHAKKN